MKKYCFHPPKNIIIGTLAAMLWVAVFPFWLLGESTPLNALVSGEVPLWDALTRLTMQDYSNITRAKWDGMLIFTMLTLLLTIPTLFRREKHRKLPLMLMLLFLLWTGLSCFFGSHAGEMNAWGVPTVLWGSGRYEGFVTIACYGLIFLCLRHMDVNIPTLLTVCSAAVTGYLVLVLLQYAGFNPLSLFPMGRSIRTNYEFQGTIGNIDLVSAWVCLLMPGLLGSFVLAKTSLAASAGRAVRYPADAADGRAERADCAGADAPCAHLPCAPSAGMFGAPAADAGLDAAALRAAPSARPAVA